MANQIETTSVSELGNEAKNRGCDYTQIWNACCSPIYRVIDEEGNNVADAQIRHLLGRNWLYVDDTDGYVILDEAAADRLILVAAE